VRACADRLLLVVHGGHRLSGAGRPLNRVLPFVLLRVASLPQRAWGVPLLPHELSGHSYTLRARLAGIRNIRDESMK